MRCLRNLNYSATSLMIPDRTECYPGWNKEYSGYIGSGYAAYVHGTEYVCLDRRPESIAGSENVDDKNFLFFIEAICQSGLESPPYENGRELLVLFVLCSIIRAGDTMDIIHNKVFSNVVSNLFLSI
ncbi:hypothetical protein DPMN_110226 [Dreissena polymorpha]|uniref:Uncharacterized protein n=1 Tax=Dreissena polymorpha TaxID=45954 RepID=A0A9D4QNT1_DREPO|nr:hypothetical protein DPMN_110226 [Dreissena polymorpha]